MMICLTSTITQASSDGELEQWILGIAQGDRNALRALYVETRAAVYGLALSLLMNPYDAEDVLQDTYIQIHAAADRYIPQQKPMAWIFTIAKNLCRHRMRDAQHATTLPPEQWETFWQTSSPDMNPEDRLVLRAVLEELSPREQQVVGLYTAGLRHREIAACLELPLSTVCSCYRRALSKLKVKLTEDVAYAEE